MHLRGVLLQSKQELYLFISSRLLVKPTTKLIVYGLLDPNTLDLRYVGRSSSGLVRPKKHIWNMTENKTRYSHLRIYRWIEILRRDDAKPTIIVLSECSTQEQLALEEIRWIALAKQFDHNLTNLSDGGEGNAGHQSFWKGKKKNPKSVELCASKTRGGRRTLEQRLEMSQQRKGRIVGNKTKEKLSKTSKHKKQIQDNFGNIYESVNQAASKFGYGGSAISRSLKNPRVVVAGRYKFTYLKAEDRDRNITTSNMKVIDQHGNVYQNVKEASEKLQVSKSSIYICINKENRTASGHILKYLGERN